MVMNKANIAEYFTTARERYEIRLRRLSGLPRPWTNDPIMQTWRFCNVFREDDRVTEWIRRNVITVLKTDEQTIVAMTACRLFNRIETLEILLDRGLLTSWDSLQALAALKGVQPVVGAAYVVKTPNGYSKAEGVCRMVDTVFGSRYNLSDDIRNRQSLRYAWEVFQWFPCIGSFMAYEIVSDLRHCDLLCCAHDVMTWSVPGPGACRGLSWLVGSSDAVPYKSGKARDQALGLMQELLQLSTYQNYWPRNWPAWEMREVEHWLCEYYKWIRVKYLGDRMKRRFQRYG